MAEDDYGGLLGAFPYAFRRSDSTLFRLYAAVGGALALVLSLAFAVSFVVSVANSVGLAAGGTSSFVRSFVVLAGFLVVLPLLAPVIYVARSRRQTGGRTRHDAALALAGFGYVLSLYLGAVVSAPPPYRDANVGPLVEFLYGLPAPAGLIAPVTAAAFVYLAHRRFR